MRLNGIELPPGTRWVDEHKWSPLDTSTQRTVSGHAIHTQKKLKGGRPITLELRATDWPLLNHEKMLQIKSILDTGKLLIFASDTLEYIAVPNTLNGSCYEFNPIFSYTDQSMNYYTGKVSLISA